MGQKEWWVLSAQEEEEEPNADVLVYFSQRAMWADCTKEEDCVSSHLSDSLWFGGDRSCNKGSDESFGSPCQKYAYSPILSFLRSPMRAITQFHRTQPPWNPSMNLLRIFKFAGS